jgi:hypothetical protein
MRSASRSFSPPGQSKFGARLGDRREAFGGASTYEAFSEVGLHFAGARRLAVKAMDRAAQPFTSVLRPTAVILPPGQLVFHVPQHRSATAAPSSLPGSDSKPEIRR